MRRTFDTPGPVRLVLKVPAGEVSLETADIERTEVELEPRHGDHAGREAVESARIELRERAEGHDVVIEVGEGRSFGMALWSDRGLGLSIGRGAEVLLRVRSPERTSVELAAGSADVDGDGCFASVDVTSGSGDVAFEHVETGRIKAGSGDVEIGRFAGEARVETGSGDARVELAEGKTTIRTASGDVAVGQLRGPGSVTCASGDIWIRELDSSLDASTASGDQRIDAVSQGSLTLKSASGDVHVGVRQGSTVWVDARSRSGSTSSELDISDVPPESDGPLVELRATTMSGDVRVVRAPAALELEA